MAGLGAAWLDIRGRLDAGPADAPAELVKRRRVGAAQGVDAARPMMDNARINYSFASRIPYHAHPWLSHDMPVNGI